MLERKYNIFYNVPVLLTNRIFVFMNKANAIDEQRKVICTWQCKHAVAAHGT